MVKNSADFTPCVNALWKDPVECRNAKVIPFEGHFCLRTLLGIFLEEVHWSCFVLDVILGFSKSGVVTGGGGNEDRMNHPKDRDMLLFREDPTPMEKQGSDHPPQNLVFRCL